MEFILKSAFIFEVAPDLHRSWNCVAQNCGFETKGERGATQTPTPETLVCILILGCAPAWP